MDVSGQLHAPVALPLPEKGPRYPLDRSLGGRQRLCGRGDEEKVSDPAGNQTPVVHPIAQSLH